MSTLHCGNSSRGSVSSLHFAWRNTCFLTWCRKAVHRHSEVVLKEEEANDREEVNEEDGQNGSQNNRAAIFRHALYHVEQRLLSDHQVKQLWREKNQSVISN